MEKNFTFSEEEIYKIFVRKRSNKVWWVELCGIILLGSEWFLENYGIHSCEISYCPRIEIFVHKYRSRVVPRTEKKMMIKFIYSEKATKFCEISTLLLTGTTQDKSKVEISQNLVAFSEYMNFTYFKL